jgi:hypothetical protein
MGVRKTAERAGHVFGRRQEAVPPVKLDAVVGQNAHDGRPYMAHALEQLFVLRLRVIDLDADCVILNYLLNRGLRIRHGIQRLASASTRIEDVEQDELRRAARLRQRSVKVVHPIHLGTPCMENTGERYP